MDNLRQDLTKNTKIIKHYIKDLSFENFQDVESQNFRKGDVEFSDNIDAIFQTYNKKNFSVMLKYACYCTLLKKKEKVFHFSFFLICICLIPFSYHLIWVSILLLLNVPCQ